MPLWKTTANALRAWMAVRGTAAVPELFVNARGEAMSRWGFAYILRCHAETARHTCPSLSKKQVSPHVLRHYVRNDSTTKHSGYPESVPMARP
ncbi:hypothetical protein BN2475_930007 [Paraburkholderia ribeironis]|uniref:Tyr recombinase domain-containing protein n=1 Tax=Paraburkholderia ribeironis TaxID=1247936 RepID=A0A1N7SL36_9BURK|nr:hypothetical protein BN2475_930007 [Paraburkholderia ribeironis]